MKCNSIISCLLFSLLSFQQPAFAASNDNPFQAARDAVRIGDRAKFERIVPQIQGAGLDTYIEYWRLLFDMNQADPVQINAFITRYDGQYIAEKMRSDWARFLGRRGRWAEFDTYYEQIVQPDLDLQCYGLQRRLSKRDALAVNEAMTIWQNQMDPPESCAPVLDALVSAKRVQLDDVWDRVRNQFEVNKISAARRTMNYLPQSQTPEAQVVTAVADKSMHWLAKRPRKAEPDRLEQELTALAIARIARNDPRMAAAELSKEQGQLEAGQKNWVWGQIGWQAALRHMPDAVEWYKRAGNAKLSDDVIQWKARIALRTGRWDVLSSTIRSMSPEMAADPTWIYWMGKALQAGKKGNEAQEYFTKLSGRPNFYGNLADEELGRLVELPAKANQVTEAEIQKIATLPGIQRSLALFKADLRWEGVREWNWVARDMNDRELLAASAVALKEHVYDRAIWSADRTKDEHDYAIRYLAPLSDEVRQAARNQSLDEAWVYGLMRQESRFVMNARSSAGASGLMQLMPRTAQWVAKKIGLKDYHHGRVNDTDVNLLLGTSYMRMVMEDLDNHPVLASAAYNAGPGRARRWRADKTIDAAVYAETIPFNETRDYVKKVMSNTVYYAALFQGKPQTIRNWLTPIGPKKPVDPKAEKLP